jgi:hypothetical protein
MARLPMPAAYMQISSSLRATMMHNSASLRTPVGEEGQVSLAESPVEEDDEVVSLATYCARWYHLLSLRSRQLAV